MHITHEHNVASALCRLSFLSQRIKKTVRRVFVERQYKHIAQKAIISAFVEFAAVCKN